MGEPYRQYCLLDALSKPAAYRFAADAVEVRQTHISAVFLVGRFAYKIKKPLKLGFLDFSTLEKRLHFCLEEVRLNHRLAPGIYLEVVPITLEAGRPVVEGRGEAIEWAVKMVRLPDQATFERGVLQGTIDANQVIVLADVISGFHTRAERGPQIARFGRFDIVAGNARENFTQSAPEIGRTIHADVFTRLQQFTEDALFHLRPIIESRADRNVPCDTHGDLHLDHVYLLPERRPPEDLVIIDCIEFNERFRFADPVADMAFLYMDLKFHGRRDLAEAFADGYFHGDHSDGRCLLPFYTAYRAAVRGKVEGFELREPEIPVAEHALATIRAKAHWLLALAELAKPAERPCLLLVGGLPGTGKSTLARALSESSAFTVVRSDAIRKEDAGLAPTSSAMAAPGQGIYTAERTQRAYAECLRRSEELLFQGRRVLVDATFSAEAQREQFLRAAQRWGVPALWLNCRADPETVRYRLEQRRGDASDADWNIYQYVASHWEAAGPFVRAACHELDTNGNVEDTVPLAMQVLRQHALA